MSVDGDDSNQAADTSNESDSSHSDRGKGDVNQNAEVDDNNVAVDSLARSTDAAGISPASATPSIPASFSAWNQQEYTSPSLNMLSSQGSNTAN